MSYPTPHEQPVIGPKTVVLFRNSRYGFGFTLRHFIVFPPESPAEQNIAGILNLTQPMDTVFVKDVRVNGPAYMSGLKPGDRLLNVNGMEVAGAPYANVVRAIQQTPTTLRLIVVPKDCDILQTLFSESAHSSESNQRPQIYANPQDFAFNANHSNTNHVQMASPHSVMANCGSTSNAIRFNQATGYLNDSQHRHSFNESIYSEPYSGRYAQASHNRYDASPNRMNPLCESSSASNLIGRSPSSASANLRQRSIPLIAQIHSSPSQRDVYGTQSSIASNYTTTDVSSTRSSIYSDKTILNDITPPSTPPSVATATNPNIANALNASGSQRTQQAKPINQTEESKVTPTTPTTTTTIAIVETPPTNPLNVDKVTLNSDSKNNDRKSEETNESTAPVMRRPKNKDSNSNSNSAVRRISYLRATANDISEQNTEQINEMSANDSVQNNSQSDKGKEDCDRNEDLQQFMEYLRKIKLEPIREAEHEGKFNIKIAYVENKRASVRHWYRVLAKLQANTLELNVQYENEAAEERQQENDNCGLVDLHEFHVTKSSYTKRKYVMKLTNISPETKAQSSTNGSEKLKTELLIQADDQSSFDAWKMALEKATRPLLTVKALEQKAQSQIQKDKPNGTAPLLEQSTKPRTWKGIVVRQLRRIHGQQPSSPNSHSNSIDIPNVASIGVPLAACPVSETNKHVPLLLARCTDIVERRGLGVVGIYRVPGNTAAITGLTELVNKGFDDHMVNDARWDDVNVVSSLLKLFLRRLPEALIPNDMYRMFIEADAQTGQKRLHILKDLINNIPLLFFESLKHLMHHLFLVSRNCVVNLMEPKNLAIIFGPSVVRESNETLESVVKDMKHQCRIIEALLTHYEYFFENGELPIVPEQIEQTTGTVPRSQTDLLLDNVAKIESFDQMDKTRFVFKFVQAARARKTKKKVTSTISSIASDTMSMDSSSTSTEYRDSSNPKTGNSTDVDGIQSHLSPDDSADIFCEDSGSMSLATLIPALEDKFYAMHNGTFESDTDRSMKLTNDSETETKSSLSSTILHNQLMSLQPLTIGDESIPYADESPDQPHLPAFPDKSHDPPSANYTFGRNLKPWNPNTHTTNNNYSKRIISNKAYRGQDAVDAKSINSISTNENDTDESNTSERDDQTIRINSEVLREMNRILTSIERKATKLNRSLSLNIKYHHSECCCNNGHYLSNSNHGSCRSMNRYSLTKDEKTDKNTNLAKKRQIQDNNPKKVRYTNRPIKRRHTVGGIHYGYNNKAHQIDATQTR